MRRCAMYVGRMELGTNTLEGAYVTGERIGDSLRTFREDEKNVMKPGKGVDQRRTRMEIDTRVARENMVRVEEG